MAIDLNQLKQKLGEAIATNDFNSAEEIKDQLNDFFQQNPSLSQTDKDLYFNARDIWAKASFVALNTLREDAAVGLFQSGLLAAFQMGDDFDPLKDVTAKLRIILLKRSAPDYRDAFKSRLRDALLQNNQSFSISVNQQKTIAQWLHDYIGGVGVEPLRDKIKLIEYLNKISVEQKLSNQDRDKLLKLFDLFEFLKLSSFTPAGYEGLIFVTDADKKFKVYDHGREIVLDKNIDILEFKPKQTMEKISTPPSKPPQPPSQPTKSMNNISAPPPIISSTPEINDFTFPLVEISNNQVSASTINLDYPSTINQLITQLGLSFADDTLKNRFNNIIASYLKGIRKEIELREVLARDPKTGGMGYDQTMVTRISDKIAELKKALTPTAKTTTSKPSLAEGLTSPAEMVIPQSEAFKSGSEKLLVEPEDILLPTGEFADLDKEKKQFISGPLSPPVTEVKVSLPPTSVPPPTVEKDVWSFDLSPEAMEPNLSTPPPANLPEMSNEINFGLFENPPSDGLLNNFNFDQPAEPPISSFTPAASPPPIKPTPPESAIQNVYHTTAPTPKPAMEEIRVTPKIYGPIDELKTITMDDWRRWGTAKEGAKRILDKINLLAEESLVKKSQGISAWKNSAVNNMYLDIGTEAIDNGLSVEQVIAKRREEKRPTLTIEEFNAVSELNQQLRF